MRRGTRKGRGTRWLPAVVIAAGLAGGAFAQDTAAGRSAFLAGDYATAKRMLEPLAEKGDADALYWTGVMYSQGKGYMADCREAAYRYEQAALQGHAEAAFNLGFMLYHGMGASALDCELIPDREKAAPWLLQAAEAGKPRAQFLVGRMYAGGDGLGPSVDEAFRWLQSAAEAGIAEAQYDLALLHARVGNGRDAYFWFRFLAEKGYPGAAQNAGRLAETMPQDDVEAIDEKVRAAHIE